MDRLVSMEVFVRVVDNGSFAASARQMNLSRAMVSKHIQALEEHLGARLLNRTTRRVSLTEVGTAFYERCQAVLADVEEAERVASDLHSVPKGVLKINAPMSFGALHLARSITAYQETYPEVQIDLILNDRVVDVVEEGFDIAIRIGELSDSSMIARRLTICRRILCAAPAYLEKHGVPENLKQLAKHNCLIYTLSPRLMEWRFTGQDGTQHSVRISGDFKSNNGEAIRVAALESHGICLQPSFIVGRDIIDGSLVPVLSDYKATDLSIYAIYPENRYVSAKVRSFIDFLANEYKGEPAWDDWMTAAGP